MNSSTITNTSNIVFTKFNTLHVIYVVYSLDSIGQLKVRLGEHDVSTTDEPTEHEERTVEKVLH